MPDAEEPCVLTAEEEALLTQYMAFYRDLETGRRRPTTAAQERFVQVTLGKAGAQTPHEIAYAKHMRLRAMRRAQQTQDIHDPADGPTEEWCSREDWYRMRAGYRSDAR